MRKLITIASILLGLTLILVAGYYWLQARATRMMNSRLQKAVSGIIANPENVKLTNKPVQVSRNEVRVPQVNISGEDLQLKSAVKVKEAYVEIHDVTINSKERKITKVGAGTFMVAFTAQDITAFLRTQPATEISDMHVQSETVSVSLSGASGLMLAGQGTFKGSGSPSPFTLQGTLLPDPATGGVLFQPHTLTVNGVPVNGKLDNGPYATPIGKLLPLQGKVTEVAIDEGTVTFRGQFDGAQLVNSQQ
jgi:hypothetical protein